MAHDSWTVRTSTALLGTLLAVAGAHAETRGDGTHALVVCTRQAEPRAVKIRVDRCRTHENPVPLDAQTLRGFTPEQLMSARLVPPGSGGAAGLSLVDGLGQLVGYVILTQTGAMVVRPAGSVLVALSVQRVVGGGDIVWRTDRGLRYFYESADCSGGPLLANGPGFDGVIRQGHITTDQPGKVVYPGDFASSQALGLTGVGSYSTPADDETGTCSHDAGDPVQVPIGGGRCCVSLSPYTEVMDVGPLVAEDLPTFVPPFSVAGF